MEAAEQDGRARPKQQEHDDEAMAKSEQLARDMQLAYELEAQQEQEAHIERSIANATNDIAQNTNILGGGSPCDSPPSHSNSGASSNSKRSSSPFSKAVGNLFNSQNRNSSLLDDGSADMQSNGSLLYVPCEINGRMVEMMIDSGSQTSVISSSMMEKLRLQKRLNKRFQGVAAGVGAARILGKIENCAVMVGAGVEFNLFFLVIDVSHDMMILGVDQMRRFNCLIDLQNNVLVFGGQGGVEVPFLPSDPKHSNTREQCSIS